MQYNQTAIDAINNLVTAAMNHNQFSENHDVLNDAMKEVVKVFDIVNCQVVQRDLISCIPKLEMKEDKINTTIEMNFNKVRDNLCSGDVYKNNLPYPSKSLYKQDHIFYDDMSVKWNRGEVERRNNDIRNKKTEYRNEDARIDALYRDHVINAIINDLGIQANIQADNIASKIFNKAYEDGHSYGYHEVLSHVSDLCDMVREIFDIIWEPLTNVKEV